MNSEVNIADNACLLLNISHILMNSMNKYIKRLQISHSPLRSSPQLSKQLFSDSISGMFEPTLNGYWTLWCWTWLLLDYYRLDQAPLPACMSFLRSLKEWSVYHWFCCTLDPKTILFHESIDATYHGYTIRALPFVLFIILRLEIKHCWPA